MNFRAKLYGLLIFTFLLNIYCSDDVGLNEFDRSVYPSQPSSLTVSFGDGVVVLKWSHPQAGEIDIFNIYRQSSTDTTFMKIDSTKALTYTDVNVNNGNLFTYGVVAVKNGFESARTISMPVSPAVFSVFINSGNEFTNSRLVELTLVAPQETVFMQISNESSFIGAQWEPFFPAKTWTLTGNDGEKTVSAIFRDADDNKSFEPATDTIILDTKAVIIEVTENTGGQVKSEGEIIHFTLNAGETDGSAFVDIGNSQRNIPLFDNGTSGDDVEDDGIYKRDFQIPSALEVTNVKIIGRFTDKVGNVAQPRESDGFVTIQNPPMAVTLTEPEVTEGAILLSWSESSAEDFSKYKVFRARLPGVSTTSKLLTTIDTFRSNTTYEDRDIEENTLYFYRVFVFDTENNFSGSNEASVTSAPKEPPEPVTLALPFVINSDTLRLNWSQSTASDFASYRIYRSEFSPVDTTQAPIVILNNNPSVTTYDDDGRQVNISYYYRVFVFDSDGLSAGSNEVMGRIN